MDNDLDLLVRVVSFSIGAWTAGHYFLGANALREASHWAKLILFPALVMSGVAMCFASVVYGSGVVFLVSLPMAGLLSIKDWTIWKAGAYMSDVLAKQARMKERMRQAYNRYRSDLTAPWESVSDLVTPSGLDELSESAKRSKDHA